MSDTWVTEKEENFRKLMKQINKYDGGVLYESWKDTDEGLYQADVARLFDVDAETIGNWEDGSRFPRIRYFPAVIGFLGFYPFDHETDTFGGKITRYKNEHGYSNEKAAAVFGVDEGTVAKWLRNECLPLQRIMKKILSVLNNKAAHW